MPYRWFSFALFFLLHWYSFQPLLDTVRGFAGAYLRVLPVRYRVWHLFALVVIHVVPYRCDSVYEEVTCWQCGGMCGEMYEDDWDDGYCEECGGEGVIHVRQCLGRCNENGEHAKKFRSKKGSK
jgi:hypothetical protein